MNNVGNVHLFITRKIIDDTVIILCFVWGKGRKTLGPVVVKCGCKINNVMSHDRLYDL